MKGPKLHHLSIMDHYTRGTDTTLRRRIHLEDQEPTVMPIKEITGGKMIILTGGTAITKNLIHKTTMTIKLISQEDRSSLAEINSSTLLAQVASRVPMTTDSKKTTDPLVIEEMISDLQFIVTTTLRRTEMISKSLPSTTTTAREASRISMVSVIDLRETTEGQSEAADFRPVGFPALMSQATTVTVGEASEETKEALVEDLNTRTEDQEEASIIKMIGSLSSEEEVKTVEVATTDLSQETSGLSLASTTEAEGSTQAKPQEDSAARPDPSARLTTALTTTQDPTAREEI